MNEYEAHLSSYDHSHKQRLKDMKAMVRDPNAAARARRAEQKQNEGGVISIKLGGGNSSDAGGGGAAGGGFKKGGFKKTGFKSAFVPVGTTATAPAAVSGMKEDGVGKSRQEEEEEDGVRKTVAAKSELVESDTDDEGYEVYDPRKPTD
jgi:hypothetical protein